MKIVKWDKFDSEKYKPFETIEEIKQARMLIINELRDNGYHFSGYYHQNGEHGSPVFDNGKQYRTSLRVWGEIMADAYPEEIDNSEGMGYCIWAWDMYDVDSLIKYPK